MPTMPPDDDPVYQLLLTLRRSDPPIWRRIAVRGSATLARLHTVLQIVMGWTDSHIHEFVVGKVRYGVPITEWPPEERARNERRFRLDQIVATVGDRFIYDYDFGDAWHLDTLVEAALGDPAHYEHDMWTEWIGGTFDPEAFDREAVNRRLKPR